MAVGGNLIPILRLSSKHKLETITIKIHAGRAGLNMYKIHWLLNKVMNVMQNNGHNLRWFNNEVFKVEKDVSRFFRFVSSVEHL